MRRAFLVDERRIEGVLDPCRLMFDGFVHDRVELVIGHDLQKIGHQLFARFQIFVVGLVAWRLGPALTRALLDFLEIRIAHGLPARTVGRVFAPTQPKQERFFFILRIGGAPRQERL